MNLRTVHTWSSLIPADDDHPYRTGAWRPQVTEYDADDLDVVEGAIPAELDGVYLRNTENPLVPAIGRYHPFDGDGMLHAIRFAGGKARYRNRMIRTAGLAGRIRFLGERPWEEVAALYRCLDLFLAPARWEGFGLTPLEAMASGVPVVAARVGAYETLIPPGDAEALAAAMARWLDDPAAMAAAGRAARAHVESNHSIEAEARALVAVYRRLLA